MSETRASAAKMIFGSLNMAMNQNSQSRMCKPKLEPNQRPSLPILRAVRFALRFIHQAANFISSLFFICDLFNDLLECGDRIFHQAETKTLVRRM